ncbi:autotransporter outer membrane beta-barrel domain-containing protein [Pseudomarimonas salicorniae]|uniref:Autotransporter outer membrane beta-barrel domain-containing protein n=1 Tax=Pseudomarimonas salicorniae TaxID=2933270 RepID=A0ABT0GHD5_9GAMM|nr:autotransporter outer membrane beta-barrel domain-containing protein [Lysobacter sp. CAU 1642]MCK7593948.1 autotransporter outer membrane beta-barrel domain-containing protein [Lysobacter sp. CAU 1642]
MNATLRICSLALLAWLPVGAAMAQQEPPTLSVAVSRAIATEGSRDPVRVELRLDRPAPPGGVCVEVDLAGGSAREGEDFRLLDMIPPIPEGGMRAEVRIQIIDDDRPEPDEDLRVVLRPSPCYRLGTPSSFTVLIRDDDDDPAALRDRLALIIENTPDPLVQSQLSSLAQLCATSRPPPGSELQRRCQLLRLALRDPGAARQLVDTLRGVLGEELSSQRRGFRSLAGGQLGSVGRRLQAVRGGAGQGLALQADGLDGVLGFLPLAAAEDEAAGLLGRGIGVFATYTRGDADRDATQLESGFDSDSDTFLLGADWRPGTGRWVLGMALAHTRFDADLDAGAGALELRQTSIVGYASRGFGQGFVDASLGWGRGSLDQSRVARFSAVTDDESLEAVDVLAADSDTELLTASVSAGWDWQRGAASFGPRAAFEYSRFGIDGFSERATDGSDAFAVAIQEQTIRSLIARLGGSAQWAISTRWGVLLPQFDAAWVLQFEDEAESLRGRFVNDPAGTAFLLPGGAVDSRYGDAGLTLSWLRAGGTSGFVSYRRLFGLANTSQAYWSLGLRLEF